MLQFIVMSIGAIYALIPIVIIVLLIAASVGLSRGSSVFAILGIGALVDYGGTIGRGGSGRAISAGPRMNPKGLKGVGSKLTASHKGAKAALAARAAAKKNTESAVNEAVAGKIRMAVASGQVGMVAGISSPMMVPPKASNPGKGNRFQPSKNTIQTRATWGGKPIISMHVIPPPFSVFTWRAARRAKKAEGELKAAQAQQAAAIEAQNKHTIDAFRAAGNEAMYQQFLREARDEVNPGWAHRPDRNFAAWRDTMAASSKTGAHYYRYEQWVASRPPPAPPSATPQSQWGKSWDAFRWHSNYLIGKYKKKD